MIDGAVNKVAEEKVEHSFTFVMRARPNESNSR